MRRMRRKLGRMILLGATMAALVLPMGGAEARECLGVRGVICYDGKQCITAPCYIR